MPDSAEEPDDLSDRPPYRKKTHDTSLTLKDYLETATDASRRTRFITIAMVVASVLLLVSVLNSAPTGWISLRIGALSDPTSKYTLEKFPLLCRCEPLVYDDPDLVRYCAEELGRDGQKTEEDIKKMFWPYDRLEGEKAKLKKELAELKPQDAAGKIIEDKVAKLDAAQKDVCDAEKMGLKDFRNALVRSEVDTKYTVRAPFFGVAFDINDIGLLGGLSLSIILIMLRLSLRNQIAGMRIGFKAALASDRARRFYEVLAAQQVFVFPYLEDRRQRANAAMGWTEAFWLKTPFGKFSRKAKGWLRSTTKGLKRRIDTGLELQDEARPSDDADAGGWRVNRNASLRLVPKLLCLLPFAIYAIQFSFDLKTRHYGDYLSPWRMRMLVIIDALFLLNILVLGLWCVAKWNEVDKLWDYFDVETRDDGGPAGGDEDSHAA
ncbi:MAG: hypothetical protein JOZ96_12925 [Acidobacteria bacterium]|nr:hypothetical protein [Acidobacteriota bacterium]